MAWLVTEPELFAMGFAVALTPPTSAAYTGVTTAVVASNKHSFLAVSYTHLTLPTILLV